MRVTGHAGIARNENVDKRAKLLLKTPSPSTNVHDKLSIRLSILKLLYALTHKSLLTGKNPPACNF